MTLWLTLSTLSPGACEEHPNPRRSFVSTDRYTADFKETSEVNHRLRSVPFTEWSLGFGQFSSHLVIRVSTGRPLDGFSASRLSRQALVPFRFRVQVGLVTQGHYAQPLPSYSEIIHAAMRRTPIGESEPISSVR